MIVVWLVVVACMNCYNQQQQQQQKLRKSSVGIICQKPKPRHNYDIIWGKQKRKEKLLNIRFYIMNQITILFSVWVFIDRLIIQGNRFIRWIMTMIVAINNDDDNICIDWILSDDEKNRIKDRF